MNSEQLKKILRLHKLWLDSNGKSGKRADLRGAKLRGAELQGANLQDAELCGADLRGADLRKANLRGADLQYADLRYAKLREADLYGADLQDVTLRDANLLDANLVGADLQGADLRDTDLQDANLRDAKLPNFLIVPTEGDFIAYKKLKNNVIAKLLIPKKAKRTNSLVGRKCRAEFVKVLELTKDNKKVKQSMDQHTGKLIYKKGAIVRPNKYDDDIRIECTKGIHFFMTKKEAEEY